MTYAFVAEVKEKRGAEDASRTAAMELIESRAILALAAMTMT